MNHEQSSWKNIDFRGKVKNREGYFWSQDDRRQRQPVPRMENVEKEDAQERQHSREYEEEEYEEEDAPERQQEDL